MMAKSTTKAAATATKEQVPEQTIAEQPASRGEVAIFKPARLPYDDRIKDRFQVDKGNWKVLTDVIFPGAQSIDTIVMALTYCQHRKLDIFKRPVHIVPMYDSKRGGYVETIWPGISELRTTATRTGQYAGCDEAVFGPTIKKSFTGKPGRDKPEQTVEVEFPEWCRIDVYKIVHGHRVKFAGPKVKWIETYATIGASELPNNMWRDRTEGQHEKCAEAAALRRAFPEEIGNEYAAEEMAGRRIDAVPAEREVIASTSLRDEGPPKRADVVAGQTKTDPMAKQSIIPPKEDEVVDGEFTETTAHDADGVVQEDNTDGDAPMDEQEAKPMAHEVDSVGLSYIQFTDAYIKALQTSKDTKDVMDFASLNQKKLDKVFKGHRESADRIRKAAGEMLQKLRPQNVDPKKKDDPISSGKPKDDRPPKRNTAAKTAIVDPEDLLKRIKNHLDAVTDPNDLSAVWEERCELIMEDLNFPGDKTAALALHKAAEKRLGID